MDAWIRINRRDFTELRASFQQARKIGDTLRRLMEWHAQDMEFKAKVMAQVASQRVSDSIRAEVESAEGGQAHGIVVGSELEGYPPDDSRQRAVSRGWATFAHRIHFGYPSSRGKGWNPRAGRTSPTPFLIPVFEQQSKLIYKDIRDGLIADIIRGRL